MRAIANDEITRLGGSMPVAHKPKPSQSLANRIAGFWEYSLKMQELILSLIMMLCDVTLHLIRGIVLENQMRLPLGNVEYRLCKHPVGPCSDVSHLCLLHAGRRGADRQTSCECKT